MTDRKLPISLSDHSEFGINHGGAASLAIGGTASPGCLLAAGIGLPPPPPAAAAVTSLGVAGVAAAASVTGVGNNVGGSKHAIAARLKHTNSETLTTTTRHHQHQSRARGFHNPMCRNCPAQTSGKSMLMTTTMLRGDHRDAELQ